MKRDGEEPDKCWRFVGPGDGVSAEAEEISGDQVANVGGGSPFSIDEAKKYVRISVGIEEAVGRDVTEEVEYGAHARRCRRGWMKSVALPAEPVSAQTSTAMPNSTSALPTSKFTTINELQALQHTKTVIT